MHAAQPIKRRAVQPKPRMSVLATFIKQSLHEQQYHYTGSITYDNTDQYVHYLKQRSQHTMHTHMGDVCTK